MPLFTDQTGRSVSLPASPRRIVSLVPSQTELLHYLGLEEEVIGITKFCVHPEAWFRTKTRVGGTKQLATGIIHQLQPDLIIANKEENVKEQVEELSRDYPVWVSDVNNLDDACGMIETVGTMVQRSPAATGLVRTIRSRFDELSAAVNKNNGPSPRTAYLIWRNPYMTVGGDTFIHDMLVRCGFENIFGAQTRYPSTSIAQLLRRSPDGQTAGRPKEDPAVQLLLLSSEPFPFTQKHADELQEHLPGTRIMLVDGEMFSWYGSRLLQAPEYFSKIRRAAYQS